MRWLPVLALAGCSFERTNGVTGDGAPPPDMPGDTVKPPDGPPGKLCLGIAPYEVCLDPPTRPYAVSGATNTGIDTDASPPECTYVDATSGPSWCVLAATTITIDENILFGSGAHPLVLFASDTISIGRGVDVGSHQTGQAFGAGADAGVCGSGGGAGSDNNGGDGGAGGSFGSRGGNGGAGGNTSNGDTAAPPTTPTFLRGGCRGDDGGNGNGGGTRGAGNHGGGAVLLLAGTRIEIAGFVNASGGGGGRGTPSKGGGGGGGSGGMIALWAPALTVTGNLVANGGGGGGGATGGTSGQVGKDPDPMMPTKSAGGGSGGNASGNGAAGAAGTTVAGNTSTSPEGAGGGGGGLGVLLVLSGQAIGGTSSPSPM